MKKNDISKVTILIATYQGEKYILESLKSIKENYEDLKRHNVDIKLETIIVDDGSTDNTEALVRSFFNSNRALNHSYVKQENQGQAQAFQNALPLINGDIVLLLDSDDVFIPKKVRSIWESFNTTPDAVMITHPQYIMDEEGKRTGNISPKAAKLSSGNIAQESQRTGSIIAPASSGLCFRAKTFKEIHPSPACGLKPCSGADSYLSLAASLKGKIIAVNEPLSEYRRHSNGKFFKRLSSIEGLKTQLELQEKMEQRLGLKNCVKHNAYFARINYVYSKLTQPMLKTLPNLVNLVQTTIKDKHFKTKDKALLISYWSLSFLAPKKLFWKMWIHFLKIR
jgi:glycosyltransferase involved in cell wall biosynthesis